jgi:hypothetical protein
MLVALSLLCLNIFADNYIPSIEQQDNIVLKKVMYKEQEINYFIYMTSQKKLKKQKEKINDKTMYFIFHGETSKAEDFLNKTDLHNKIITNNDSFIAFNSSANDWFSHERKNIKDNAFILNLIKKAQNIKFSGIYGYKNYKVIAYSSGGSLVNKFICENKIKNIEKYLIINSSGKEDWLNNCSLLKNKNISLINSDKDDYYTYEDIKNKNKKYKLSSDDFLTLKDYQNKKRIKLNCSSESISSEIDNTLEDSSHITYKSYNCNNKNNLEIYTLHYAGHNIPNTKNLGLEDFRGVENKDIYVFDIIN